MRPFYINFALTVVFTVIICLLNYKQSGGDIFAQFMIVSFVMILVITSAVVRSFTNFNFKQSVYGILLGIVFSYIVFMVFNYFATK